MNGGARLRHRRRRRCAFAFVWWSQCICHRVGGCDGIVTASGSGAAGTSTIMSVATPTANPQISTFTFTFTGTLHDDHKARG
jgi:hypothetical protein